MAITLNGTTGITTPGLSADSPTLTVDSANNRVGIGTTEPNVALHILSATTGFRVQRDINSLAINPNYGGQNHCAVEITNSLSIFTGGGSEKLRIDSTGNVGIGLTNPISKLHISVPNGTGQNGGIILQETGNQEHRIYVDNAHQYNTINSSSGTWTWDSGGVIAKLTTTGLGIGTDNPVGSLEVRDSKANLIVAKDGLTVKSNSDLHTTYDTLQIGAGGALLSYSTATVTADTQFVHNAYRSSGGTFKYRYADSAARIRMNSPQGEIIFDNAASGSADADITFSERLRIKSNGIVQVGDAGLGSDNGDRRFEVIGSGSGQAGVLIANNAVSASGTCDIIFAPSNKITGAQIICKALEDFSTSVNRTADLTFYTRKDGTLAEKMRILAGGGITFNGDTADANALDDYEEGTWTPTVTSAGYTQEGSNQFGIYTKIGRLVHISGQFSFSAINTSSDSVAIFSGLPFTVKSGGHQVGLARETETTGAIFVMQVNANSSTFGMNSMDNIIDNSNVQIATGKNYNFSVTYEI